MQSHSDRNATVRLKEASVPLHSYIPDFTDSVAKRGYFKECMPTNSGLRERSTAECGNAKQKWKASRENVSKDSFATEQSAMRQFAKGTRMRHHARSQPRAQGYQRHADKLDLCSVREP
jgi:hypothetical protein